MIPRRKLLSPLPVGIVALLLPLAAACAGDRSCESLARLKTPHVSVTLAKEVRTFDVDRDAAKAHAIDSRVDEFDPNLTAFAERGGKLLIYHGWADQQVAPGSSVEFYEAAREHSSVDRSRSDWIRLFMAPGMGHCQGGEGPDTFDALGAMEQWVEKGHAPERIVASQLKDGHLERTRPLCPYPQVARYDGKGNADDEASFVCR